MLHQISDWRRYPDEAEFVYVPCPVCRRMSVLNPDQLDKDGCGLIDCHGGTAVRLLGFGLIRASGTA